ncbi:MAG: class I SAM-dependent methyltransferase [Anaerolineales bacterium]|nr:class I SAM-dependent methyltransferase [Anaerolineales bacterium]
MEKFRQFHLGKLTSPFQWLYALPRVFFGLFYHGLAGLYDAVTLAISMGLWRRWLAATLPYLRGSRVLEIGHGPGHLQKMLAEDGNEVYGLEESFQMIHLARRRLQRAGYTPRLARGVGQAFPFRSSFFDHVVTTFPAEFITHPDTLAEIRRSLKPGGQLLVLRFAWLSGQRWPYKAVAWLFRLVGEAPADGLPEGRLVQPFREAGFQVRIEQLDLGSSGVLLLRCIQQDAERPLGA